ncbi:MAG: TetR/AcrR family transcriptional regulator [Desulfosudaceae bacterium]
MFSDLKKEEKENRRRLIVATAEELFREDGLDGLTLRNVARRIGVAPGTIYTYFKNKEELLLHVLSNNLDLLEDGLEAGLNLPDPVSCLSAIAGEYRQYFLRLGRYVNVIDFVTKNKESAAEVSPLLLDEIRDKVAGLLKKVEARIAADDMRPLIKDLPPSRAVAVLWAMAQGITALTLPTMIDEDQGWFHFEQLLNDMLYLLPDHFDIS